MKQESFELEFNRLFKSFENETSPSLLNFELGPSQNLWDFLLIGDSYYFILNHHSSRFEFVSKEIENVMGYHPSEVDLHFMNEQLHPDDRSWFLAIGTSLINFFSQLPPEKIMKYKVRYDIRFKRKNGDYARI